LRFDRDWKRKNESESSPLKYKVRLSREREKRDITQTLERVERKNCGL